MTDNSLPLNIKIFMYNNVWGRGEAELLNEKGYKKFLFLF